MQPVSSSFSTTPAKRPAEDELEGHYDKRARTEESNDSQQIFSSEPLYSVISEQEDLNVIFARLEQMVGSSDSDEEILSILELYPCFISWTSSKSPHFLLTQAIQLNRINLVNWMINKVKQSPSLLTHSLWDIKNTEIVLVYAAIKEEWQLFDEIATLGEVVHPISLTATRSDTSKHYMINSIVVSEELYQRIEPQIRLFNLIVLPDIFCSTTIKELLLAMMDRKDPSASTEYCQELELTHLLLEELHYDLKGLEFKLNSISFAKFKLDAYVPYQEAILTRIAQMEIRRLNLCEESRPLTDLEQRYRIKILTALNDEFAFFMAIKLDQEALAFKILNRKEFLPAPPPITTFETLMKKTTFHSKLIIILFLLKGNMRIDRTTHYLRSILQEMVNVISDEKRGNHPLRRLEIFLKLGEDRLNVDDRWAAHLSFSCVAYQFYDLYETILKTFPETDFNWNTTISNDDIGSVLKRIAKKGNWKLFFELKERHQVTLEMHTYLLRAAMQKQWGIMEKIISMDPRVNLNHLEAEDDDQKIVPFGYTALSYALAEEENTGADHVATMLIFLGAKHVLCMDQIDKPLDVLTIEEYRPFLLEDGDDETGERLKSYIIAEKKFKQLTSLIRTEVESILVPHFYQRMDAKFPKEILNNILAKGLKHSLPALASLPDHILVEKAWFHFDARAQREKKIHSLATKLFYSFSKVNRNFLAHLSNAKLKFLQCKIQYYIEKYKLEIALTPDQMKVFLHIFGKEVPEAERKDLKAGRIFKNRFRIALKATELV